MSLPGAYFSPADLVPADRAVGRVSGRSLAAYPPGIPSVLPGVVITTDVLDFLPSTRRPRSAAASLPLAARG